MKQLCFVRQIISYETLLPFCVSGFRIIVTDVITVQFCRAQVLPVTLYIFSTTFCRGSIWISSAFTQHVLRGNVGTSSRAVALFGKEALLPARLSENHLQAKHGFLWSFFVKLMNIKQLAKTIFFLNQCPGVLWGTLSPVSGCFIFSSFFFPHVYLAESVNRIIQYIKLTGTHKDHGVLKLVSVAKNIIQMHLQLREHCVLLAKPHKSTGRSRV